MQRYAKVHMVAMLSDPHAKRLDLYVTAVSDLFLSFFVSFWNSEILTLPSPS